VVFDEGNKKRAAALLRKKEKGDRTSKNPGTRGGKIQERWLFAHVERAKNSRKEEKPEIESVTGTVRAW